MRKLSVFLGVALWAIGSAVSAQEVDSTATMQKLSWGDAKTSEIAEYIPDVCLDTRFGYCQDFSGHTGRFGGNGLFLDINGKIGQHFSYSLNHRLADFEGEDGKGFDNTNWLLLTYETEHFSISAGKDALFVGNFEYDAYDLDSYWFLNSMFWNNISPWQWSISAAWYPAEDQSLSFQFCNSPFSDLDTGNLFAYALAWRGAWDFYESYWTANLWQYTPKGYVGAFNFGNRFYLGDFTIDLEYMTRSTSWKGLFSGDFTIDFSPSYEWEWGRAFGKFGWERIKDDTLGYVDANEDGFTGDGFFYGAGIEFFPLKKYKDLRIHAAWGSGTYTCNSHILEIGLTWKLNLTEAGKALFNRIKK